MHMNSIIRTGVALAALYCTGIVFAGGEGWTSDFSAATKEAAESKKDLLVDFTGSDWCGWCIKLNDEVFSKEPFKAGVKDKFVLVELDYPNDRSKLSAETLKQNEELGKKYQVRGYPTILLCDSKGRPYAATGYEPGGPESYVKNLDKLRENKVARDKAFEAAVNLEGVAKAKQLVAALDAMGLDDGMVRNFYGNVIDQIKTADPDDDTGFLKATAAKARVASFQEELGMLAQKEDFDGAMVLVDKTLKEGGFTQQDTLQMMMTRAMIFAEQKKYDEALKAADEAKAFAPDSGMSAGIDEFKESVVATRGDSEEEIPAADE